MMNINIDISNTLIGSYSLDANCSKVQIIFSGIPEEWQGNRIYAAFVQDNLLPTVEVINNAVSVPQEIIANGTDFYVSVYSIAYGSRQVSEPSSPILITVKSANSTEFDLIKLIKSIISLEPKIDALEENKIDKVEGKGLSSNDFTDDYKMRIEDNEYLIGDTGNLLTESSDNLVNAINEIYDMTDNKLDKLEPSDTNIIYAETKAGNTVGLPSAKTPKRYSVPLRGNLGELLVRETPTLDNEATSKSYVDRLNPAPIYTIPTTLSPNKQYNFGEVTSLSLAFPTYAEDGDVVYLTFFSGAAETSLTIDTTNTCDIEVVPETNTGYEIFGKYNGLVWIVNYSEYIVSEG